MFNAAGLNSLIDHRICDIRDQLLLDEIFEEFQPEIVFHLAAQPLVRKSYADPKATFEINVIGSVNVMEACNKSQTVRAFVNVTTDKVYDNKEWVYGYRETDRLGGRDPYSASKACVELLSACYENAFFKTSGVNSVTVRAGNVVGGGDWSPDRLIPDVLRSIERNKPIELRNPQAVRPWQHVLEPLFGYIELASRLFAGEESLIGAWNFGPNDTDLRSVKEAVDILMCLCDDKQPTIRQSGDHPHEADMLKLDITKAKTRLTWKPVWSLKEALEHTLLWHQESLKNEDMLTFTRAQISEYSDQRERKLR
jgi:CDP-glucose 4,6-dehydratase